MMWAAHLMRRLAILLLPLLTVNCAQPRLPASIPKLPAKPRVQYVMRYTDIKPGAGALAEPGKLYVLHYTGWLWDGTKFDSSRDKDKPFSFEQGKRKVIPGFDAGFQDMRVGGQRRLFIPYQLAYGEKGRGKIPGKANLIFDVELLEVKEPPPEAPPNR